MKFESLANELLLELFEYFDGAHLFHIFSGLNSRFNQLLLSNYQMFRFNFRQIAKEDFDIICKQHFPLIIDRIISIQISNGLETPTLPEIFLGYGFTLSQLTSLKFVKLDSVKNFGIFTKITIECLQLSNLEYLTMIDCNIGPNPENYRELFNKLWQLPKLKYLKFDDNEAAIHLLTIPPVSSFIQTLWLKDCNVDSLLHIFKYTPNLQRFTTRLFRRFDCLPFKPIISSLVFLKLNFYGTENTLRNIFQCLPNLYYLTIKISWISWDGYQWKDITEKYFPKLKKLRFKVSNYSMRPDTNVDDLLDTFRTSFWIEQQQCFVGCQWCPDNSPQIISFYTLPYVFPYRFCQNGWRFKSTYLEEQDCYSFNHDHTVQYSANEISFINKFPFRFPNICNLSIQFPCNYNFLSSFLSFQQLRWLSISISQDDDYLYLQLLLDRAPCLYSLQHNHKDRLSKKFFELTSSSIRELDLACSRYYYYFNTQDCMDLVSSPLGLQCEVLSIRVSNRMDIFNLIEQMSNLRSLRFTCRDVDWYSPQNKRNFVVWLKDHLSSSFSFTEHQSDVIYIDLWINRQNKQISRISKREHRSVRFSAEIKQFFKKLFHLNK